MARKLDTPHSSAIADATAEPAPAYDSPVLTAVVSIVAAFTAAPLLEQFAARAGIPADSKAVTALFTLSSAGPMRPSTLAERLDISLAGASRALDALAEAQLAVRTPDPGDARATIAALTPDGKTAARELFHYGDLMMHELMHGWSARDRDELARLLTRFAASVASAGSTGALSTPPDATSTAPQQN